MTALPSAAADGSSALDHASACDNHQYISFEIGDDHYALDITHCLEIRGWTPVTSLPNQSDYVRGVLNLRGAVVPVIDLRSRFWGKTTDATPTHVVIVVSFEDQLAGLLVDAVSNILTIPSDQLKDIPEIGTAHHENYLENILTSDEEMIAILSVASLLSGEDWETLSEFDELPASEEAVAPTTSKGRKK